MSFGARRMTWEQRDKALQDRLWWLVFTILGGIVGAVVGHVARFAVAEAAAFSTIAILMTARLFDAWVERRLYWLFMTAVVLAHLALVVVTPWPLHHRLTKTDSLLLVGDLILVILAGELVHRLARRRDAAPPKP